MTKSRLLDPTRFTDKYYYLPVEPCPFCGGNADFLKEFCSGPEKIEEWKVHCTSCGAQTKAFSEYFENEEKCKVKAINLWNTRVQGQ